MMQTIDFSRIIFRPVTVTFLEMHKKPSVSMQPVPGTEFRALKKPVAVAEYRSYYYGVGEKYHWLDRMVIPDEELYLTINTDNTDIFIFRVNNETAGYIEFVKEKRFVEILYFGLLPGFTGKGLGKYFLQWVINKAWGYNPEWIQLNTCTLDHPNALPNYKKAGFIEVRSEIQQRRVME
jgi:GNAT superfamily N-acetyltransferase